MSLGRLWCEYFENTSGSSSSEESSYEDKPDSWLFNDQSDNRHREFCRMQHYYRPHFTKITKIWQDLRPIRKSSIILRSGKTLLILLHPPLFNLRRKIFFTDCVDEDYWDEDNSHTASSRNFLFPRSPSSLALCLFIVLNLDSFHEIFLRGARIRRRVTFDTHEIKKWINTNKNTTMIHTPANLFHECENTQRTQVAQAPVVRWSSCTITVMAAGGIIRVCMKIFTTALRNKTIRQKYLALLTQRITCYLTVYFDEKNPF